EGVVIRDAGQNTIGGTTTAGRNYIVNSKSDGVQIVDSNASVSNVKPVTTGNTLQDNYIGLAPDGLTAQANHGNGVLIDSAALTSIGGSVPGARNVISGNDEMGILIQGIQAKSNFVVGDYIG